MLFCGISWGPVGYRAAGVDAAGEEIFARDFPPGPLDGLIAFLRAHAASADDELCCVIDSTNGTLDLHLLTAGLVVYRADPWLLPTRPVDGSVPATTLAKAAAHDPAAITRLALSSGTLGGRTDAPDHYLHIPARLPRHGTPGDRQPEYGARQPRRVALTFDDGPCPPYTDRILDILRSYRVTASFFCIGLNAAGYPATVGRIAEEGHTLGNHTWSHPFLPDLGPDEFSFQIEATATAISTATGSRPRLVRPPYGAGRPEVLDWLTERDLTCVLWDNDSRDWAAPGAAAITERVTARLHDGPIVLLHDGGGDRSQTVAALPAIIERLLAGNYTFVGADAVHPGPAYRPETGGQGDGSD
ncbi:polysaccharide deacetylase family protein [Nocardia sp. NPDC088792]|uniref:polysaccharide deacetylase family protein n=1 Tax=Nocardia sp. NPDC088792 TaxID=3364332 RepID=UPI0037F41998